MNLTMVYPHCKNWSRNVETTYSVAICLTKILAELIAASDDFDLTLEELKGYMVPSDYTGRSADQVDRYLKEFVEPVISANSDLLGVDAQITV